MRWCARSWVSRRWPRAWARGCSSTLALWPLGGLIDRYHPARGEFEPLIGNGRAFAQAGWRHLLFGAVLAELERRLNDTRRFEPLEQVPASSNGHGDIERATVTADES